MPAYDSLIVCRSVNLQVEIIDVYQTMRYLMFSEMGGGGECGGTPICMKPGGTRKHGEMLVGNKYPPPPP